MPLEKGMNISTIINYLTKDLKKSIENDVYPCLNLGHDEGGYFAVPRLVLSYVDYLGSLYNGYSGKTNKNKRRIFTDNKYAKTFLNNIFSKVDSNYGKYGALLWEIYRNGTVHLYSPKTLKDKNSNITIGWITHKLDRNAKLDAPYNFQAEHLVPHDHGNNKWSQPISIKCLYEDLISSLDVYSTLISQQPSLEQNFIQTADALIQPEEIDAAKEGLRWW